MKKAKIILYGLSLAVLFTACQKENSKTVGAVSKPENITLKTASTPADVWELLPGAGTDISAGADGSVFITDTTTVSPTGGFRILKWNGNSWTVMPGAAGVKIAVDPQGTPWVVNKSNLIYKYNGNLWTQMPGTATDIGIGANGSVFITDTTTVSPTGGFRILKWNGSSWTVMPGAAGVRIAVDAQGTPWVVNKSHLIYKYNGNLWIQMPGTATDIGIGANGAVYISGTTVVSSTGGYKISKWNGTGWTDTALGSGVNVTVDPNGHPWTVNASHLIYRNLNL
ncbi:hypothetical protein CKK33_01030 [Mucilaginibacter sp. MD40]|uniref:tectonin domain-containing protein n=1 Tax=Mucilaginibacter sp. MD40 TaxID=2029590 RepID=UPI000BAC69C9|nr:tectonin domain-containing protein [Mucilaginibacter sp. MD40]PAW92152.1 hypothetical protein CKK33_01030 [Mucilaginibacter sp. MD40]